MAANNGTATILKIGGVRLANGKSVNFDQSVTMLDVTNKDSGGNKAFIPGDREGKVSFEGLFDETISATAGFDLLNSAVQAGTALTAMFAGPVKNYSYTAYVSGLNRVAPENAVETFTCNLQLSGAQTET